ASFPFGSSFDHAREKASPAYYEVFLEDYQVNARLSSTLRCGIHEYTWMNGDTEKKLLFDLGKANNQVSDWEIRNTSPHELKGYQQVGRDKIHFAVRLSHAIEKLELTRAGKRDGYALVHLAHKGESPVTLKIGLSYVSEEGAARNLQEEIGDRSFEEIRQEEIG